MNRQKGLSLILIIVLVALAIGGYLIYQKQFKPVPTPQQTTQPTPTPTSNSESSASAETTNSTNQQKPYTGPPQEKIIILRVTDRCQSDQQFCGLLLQILSALKDKNFSSLLTLQEKSETLCISGSHYGSVCDGAKEGEKRNGYNIGKRNSEFNTLTDDQYIAKLNEYFVSKPGLDYQETVVSTNWASIVYAQDNNQTFLVFNLAKNEDNWRIKDAVYGVEYKTYLKEFYPTIE